MSKSSVDVSAKGE